MSGYWKFILFIVVLLIAKQPVLAVIVLVVAFIAEVAGDDSSTDKSTTYKKEKEDYSDIGILLLSGAIIATNQEVNTNQLTFVRSYLNRRFLPEHVARRMAMLEQIVYSPVNIGEACRRVVYYTEINARHQVIEYLFELARAKGPVTYNEMLLIRKISERIMVDYPVYEAIQNRYYKAGFNYDNSYTQSQQVPVNRWYQILGIKINASADEVKKSYRKLVLQYHPDRWSSATKAEQEKAKKKFQEIQEAYEQIKAERGIV